MSGGIDIAFGIDDGYAPHLAALIASIVRGAPGASLRLIVLHVGVTPARRKLVESVAPDARFLWVEVGDDDVPAFAARAHFNRTTLFRLGLEHLAPADCDRILYLDSDMIVLGDVRELWAMDLAGAPVGAVTDSWVDAAAFAERWGLPASPLGYFNAGMLLIDLAQVRAQGLFTAAARFVAEHDRALPFNDQDGLNATLWGRWRPLPPMWNAQNDMVVPWLAPGLPSHLQFHETLPALVHFTGAGKPWTPGHFHPWAWIYWDNLARTPFAGEVARATGIGAYKQFRMWLRWLRRRPVRRAGAVAVAGA